MGEEVFEACQQYGIRALGYDRFAAEEMAQRLAGRGLTVEKVEQGFALNEAIVKVMRLARDRHLAHGGDAILSWMAGNVQVRHGYKKDIRLDKDKSGDKIDGIAALAMAFRVEIEHPDVGSVYDTRGVLTVG